MGDDGYWMMVNNDGKSCMGNNLHYGSEPWGVDVEWWFNDDGFDGWWGFLMFRINGCWWLIACYLMDVDASWWLIVIVNWSLTNGSLMVDGGLVAIDT